MVFQPAIFLLCLLVVGRTVVVGGQSLIVFPIEEGVGWSEGELEIEVRTAAGEEGVVGRIAGERKADVEVVTVAVGDEEIVAVPVLHVVARVADIDHKLEIVIGPVKALSEADIQTDDVHVFVGVVVIGRVVVAAVVAIAGVILRIIVAIIVVIVGTIVGLMGIERREGEVVGPLSAKPRVGEGEREVGVVTAVGLCSQREGLTIALRDEASTLIAAAAEDILERKVGELQAGTQEDTRLSPTERELHLVAALCGEGIGDVYRSGLSIGANVFENLLGEVFRVELSH